MGALTKWVNKLHAGKPVEPPTAPPPINMESTPFELPVPYALEEFPRTFLHLLLVAKDTPPQLKQDIQTWLTDYEEKLMTYMHTRYGEGADQVMDMITRSVMQQQHMTATAKNKAAENDILSDLEKSLKEDSGGTAEGSTA